MFIHILLHFFFCRCCCWSRFPWLSAYMGQSLLLLALQPAVCLLRLKGTHWPIPMKNSSDSWLFITPARGITLLGRTLHLKVVNKGWVTAKVYGIHCCLNRLSALLLVPQPFKNYISLSIEHFSLPYTFLLVFLTTMWLVDSSGALNFPLNFSLEFHTTTSLISNLCPVPHSLLTIYKIALTFQWVSAAQATVLGTISFHVTASHIPFSKQQNKIKLEFFLSINLISVWWIWKSIAVHHCYNPTMLVAPLESFFCTWQFHYI